jgi:2-polyprenyl-3-methyl-5-hydroxy-6-metoxy-1,4-benzoquinol methylase
MRSRVMLAGLLIRLGEFIRSLAIMVMKPDDLVEFSRHRYSESSVVNALSAEQMISRGLDTFEQVLLDKVPIKEGRLLLLGLGGGREAIQLSALGFKVTGVDFVPEMVVEAQRNASRRGLRIDGLHQEVSELDVPSESYEVVWLSSPLYSSIPTVGRRVQLLERAWKGLKPGGYMVLQYLGGTPVVSRHLPDLLRKTVALITWGNIEYERGDQLWANGEFVHVFSNEGEIRSEIGGTGFEVLFSAFPKENSQGGSVLRKSASGRS